MPPRTLTLFLLVAVLAVACGGGDSDENSTPVPSATLAVTPSPTLGGPTATPTSQGFTNARQALDAYIREQLGAENIGACPTAMVPGQPPAGICTTLLYESAELTTYLLGVPFGEGVGELVLTRDVAVEVWDVEFVAAPVLGEELAVNKTAVVFGAGDCLNFREGPNPDAPVFICAIDGTKGMVFEGPLLVGGIAWWRVGEISVGQAPTFSASRPTSNFSTKLRSSSRMICPRSC